VLVPAHQLPAHLIQLLEDWHKDHPYEKPAVGFKNLGPSVSQAIQSVLIVEDNVPIHSIELTSMNINRNLDHVRCKNSKVESTYATANQSKVQGDVDTLMRTSTVHMVNEGSW
jgi:hypothetical protein